MFRFAWKNKYSYATTIWHYPLKNTIFDDDSYFRVSANSALLLPLIGIGEEVRSMVRKGTTYTYTALVPTVIGVGEQDPARMVVAVRKVGSMVRKGTNTAATVPTVIGVGEEESRQDGRSGETGQVDGSKRNYLYGTGSYRNWRR
jgi:hypothetical protein